MPYDQKNVFFDDLRPLRRIAHNVLACYVQIRVCLQVVLTLAEEKFCVKKVIFACENLVVRKTRLTFASLSGLKIKPLRF